MGKVAPVGTIRVWQSGTVIKATESSIFTDGWLAIPTIPGKLKDLTSQLDEMAREIIRFKQPIEGELWLEKELKEFRTSTGDAYDLSSFKKYNGWYGATQYSFTNEFTRQFLSDKIRLQEEIDEALLEANKEKGSEVIHASGEVNEKYIHLTKEEQKEIRDRVRRDFKESDKPLDLKDIEELKDKVKNVLGYLKQGENFIGEKKDIYEDMVNKRNHFLDDYERLPKKKLFMEECLDKMTETFKDNWGIRESYRKKFLNVYQDYISKYREKIYKDELTDFKKNLGCELNAPIGEFYSKLEKLLNNEEVLLSDYIGKRIPSPFDKHRDIILLGVNLINNIPSTLQVKDPYTGEESKLLFSYEKDIIKSIKKRKAIDIDLPLKLRFKELYDKSLEGGWEEEDINILKNLENVITYLPDGHCLTNQQLRRFRKEGEYNSTNGYAFYSPKEKEIYLSNDAVSEVSSSFKVNSGNTFNSVIIHEIGHSVSQKLSRAGSLEYRKFTYECGWSWTQFPGNKGYTATGYDKDIQRLGPHSQQELITEYAHKSPEEAFAEYYSFYSQHKTDIDKFLKTGEVRSLQRDEDWKGELMELLNKKDPKTSKKAEDILRTTTSDIHVMDNIEEQLRQNKRNLREHLQCEYIHPFSGFDKDFHSEIGTRFTKREHQEYLNVAKDFPIPVFSVKHRDGSHELLTAIDHLGNRANRSFDGLTPTFSISEDSYSYLRSKNYSDLEIRDFVFSHFIEKGEEVKKLGYKPKVQKEVVHSTKGLRHVNQVISSSIIIRNKKIFEQMKKIWESDELKKALDEINGIVGDGSEEEKELSKSDIFSFFGKIKEKIVNLVKSKKKPNYGDTLVFNHKNELLLVRRSTVDEIQPGKWCLPGGKIEEGETPSQGAVRELQEETALVFTPDQVTPLRVKKLSEGNEINYFTVNLQRDELVGLDNDEHFSYEWVPLEKLKDYELIFDLADYLENELLPKCTIHPVIESKVLYKDLFIKSLESKDELEKSLNYEWRDRKSKKGNIFRQRFRVNLNKENIEPKTVQLDSELRDRLFTSHLYQGDYYNLNGERLQLTPEQKLVANKEFDSRYNYANLEQELFGTEGRVDRERQQFNELLPTINLKNRVFREVYELEGKTILEKTLDFSQSPLQVAEVLERLSTVRSLINSELNPEILISGNDLVGDFELPLDQLIERFSQYDSQSLIHLGEISIKNLDDYTYEDITLDKSYEDIYSLVNSRLRETSEQIEKSISFIKEGFNNGMVDTYTFIDYMKKYNEIKKAIEPKDSEEEKQLEDNQETPEEGEEQSQEQDNQDEDKRSTTGHTEEELRQFAQQARQSDLQSVISRHGDPMLRKIAHEELDRRTKEEHVQGDEVEEIKGDEDEGESTFEDPEKVKHFLQESKTKDPEDLKNNPFIAEMTEELEEYKMSPEHKYVDSQMSTIDLDNSDEGGE